MPSHQQTISTNTQATFKKPLHTNRTQSTNLVKNQPIEGHQSRNHLERGPNENGCRLTVAGRRNATRAPAREGAGPGLGAPAAPQPPPETPPPGAPAQPRPAAPNTDLMLRQNDTSGI